MHVVFFAHTSTLYGASRSLLTLLEGLRREGAACTVIVRTPGDLIPKLEEVGADCVLLPFELWASRGERHAAGQRHETNRALAARLATTLTAEKVDLVYTNASMTSMGAMYAGILGRPHVWHLREFGDIDYHWEFDLDFAEVRQTMLTAEAIIANSKAVLDHHLRGAAHANASVIYNGVVWKEQLDSCELRVTPPPADPVFAMVGHFNPGKRQLQAIQAFDLLRQRYPRARLRIAGDGYPKYEELCRQQAADLGLADSVEFLGRVDAPWDVYRASRALLMCSGHEAFGRVTVEAMAVGRAVIGTATGGTPEVIEHGKTGLLYNGETVELVAAIARLCEDGALAKTLGMAARRKVIDSFTNEQYVATVRQVIRTCIGR